jgi:Phage integrase family
MHGAAATRVPERFGGQRLPTVEAVDLRRERPPPGHFISPPLAAAVKTALERREQALLFLNRRDYAPLTLRRACVWKRIAKVGALPSDVTPHTLRHTFASVAADLGYSEPTIATLIGHKGRTTFSADWPNPLAHLTEGACRVGTPDRKRRSPQGGRPSVPCDRQALSHVRPVGVCIAPPDVCGPQHRRSISGIPGRSTSSVKIILSL